MGGKGARERRRIRRIPLQQAYLRRIAAEKEREKPKRVSKRKNKKNRKNESQGRDKVTINTIVESPKTVENEEKIHINNINYEPKIDLRKEAKTIRKMTTDWGHAWENFRFETQNGERTLCVDERKDTGFARSIVDVVNKNQAATKQINAINAIGKRVIETQTKEYFKQNKNEKENDKYYPTPQPKQNQGAQQEKKQNKSPEAQAKLQEFYKSIGLSGQNMHFETQNGIRVLCYD